MLQQPNNKLLTKKLNKKILTKKSNSKLLLKTKRVKFKKSIVAVLIVCAVFLLSCNKNTDTFLQSQYFKNNKSNQLPQYISSQSEDSSSDLAKAVLPAVVAIVASTPNGDSIGSGVCVKSGGYILTNQHVVAGSNNIKLFFSDGTGATAVVLWQDEIMDIAILKSSVAIPYLHMGENKDHLAGDNVLAIGTPLSLNFTHTVTKGIISATNRTIKINTSRGEALMQNLIQHDASINPGNSGGPLVDMNGSVVGINTLKISTAEGLGFAIPIDSVQVIVNNIYQNYNYKTPFIGLLGYDNSLNLVFENQDVLGFYVESVKQDSPAHDSGLQKGDIIIKIDDQVIEGAMDFRKELFKHHANEVANVEYVRDGKLFNTKIALQENTNFLPDNEVVLQKQTANELQEQVGDVLQQPSSDSVI